MNLHLSPDLEDIFKTLSSCVKYNNGYFKSQKQSNFLLSKYKSYFLTDKNDVMKRFGIHVDTNELCLAIGGMVEIYAGRNGMQPVTWVFILDMFGVLRKYKLKYKDNKPDPSKTKQEFIRNTDEGRPEWSHEDNLNAALHDANKKRLEEL